MTGVFITGLGAVSHVAPSVPGLLTRLFAPRLPQVSTPDIGDAQIPIRRFAMMHADDRPSGPARHDGMPVGDSTRAALAAAREALEDAGVASDGSRRIGVVLGSSNGDAYLVEQYRARGDQLGIGRWVPTFAAASVVAGEIGARGPAISVSNACAGSGYAIAVGVGLIESGEADVVVAGGYETFSRVAMGVFNQVGAVTPGECIPFARDRAGTTLGEAAATVVLERADLARTRSARIYGEVAGQGWSCDAYHATGLDPDGGQLVRAMRDAMSSASIGPADLSVVVPHGTGTRANDSVEAAAMAVALRPHSATIPVYSSKALLGHTAGASGALSVIAALTFLRRGVMAPNIPVGLLDPNVELNIPTVETPLVGGAAMVNTYAFGGNNMSLVLKKVSDDA